MQYRQRHNAGLTLVEMLIVVTIITILTATAIPVLARSGFLGGNKVDLAAREAYTILRAAQVYATTNNIETAVLYVSTPTLSTDPNTIRDSFLVDPAFPSIGIVPVVDSLVIARKLTDREIIDLKSHGSGVNVNADIPVFVPLSGPEGFFRVLPNEMCILPDVFEWDGDNGQSMTGLQAVRLFNLTDPVDAPYFDPREVYDPKSLGNTFTFPAHVFLPEGRIDKAGMPKERAFIRVGYKPNALVTDRFTDDPSGFPNLITNHTVSRPVAFNGVTPLDDVLIYLDTLRENPGKKDIIDSLEIDSQIEIYFSLGRIRIRS